MDYRAALRERSGVGEYAHQVARALLAAFGRNQLALTLFSSSWKDRLRLPADVSGSVGVDCRVPVSVLNLAWHRLGWPPVEYLARGAFDVAHSLHPLLMPTRSAAQVITIHDLNFMTHPERTRAEIRRDYPALARHHAHRADHIIVVSEFTAREVERHFDVPRARMSICPSGAPDWKPRAAAPADGYVLFFGTLEARKNVGGLLDAYEQLAGRRRDLPRLVLAGQATEQARPWLERLHRLPLRGLVEHVGYVASASRRALYEGARLLVQPSFEEGFGMPVLEAMTLGVPVVASNAGALPEVVGDAGPLVDPGEPEALAAAIEHMIDDEAYAAQSAARGLRRAATFRWDRTAALVHDAYEKAIEHRLCASA